MRSCDGKESRSHRKGKKIIKAEGSVDLQVGHGPKIKLHENGPWDGVTAGLAMLSALHGLGQGYTSDFVKIRVRIRIQIKASLPPLVY